MNICGNVARISAVTIVLLSPSLVLGAYTWSSVGPTNGTTVIVNPLRLGAIVKWLTTDPAPTTNDISALPTGWSGTVNYQFKYTDNGDNSATFGPNDGNTTATAIFSPLLDAGTSIRVTYTVRASNSGGTTQSTTSTVASAQ